MTSPHKELMSSAWLASSSPGHTASPSPPWGKARRSLGFGQPRDVVPLRLTDAPPTLGPPANRKDDVLLRPATVKAGAGSPVVVHSRRGRPREVVVGMGVEEGEGLCVCVERERERKCEERRVEDGWWRARARKTCPPFLGTTVSPTVPFLSRRLPPSYTCIGALIGGGVAGVARSPKAGRAGCCAVSAAPAACMTRAAPTSAPAAKGATALRVARAAVQLSMGGEGGLAAAAVQASRRKARRAFIIIARKKKQNGG